MNTQEREELESKLEYHNKMARNHERNGNSRQMVKHWLEANIIEKQLKEKGWNKV